MSDEAEQQETEVLENLDSQTVEPATGLAEAEEPAASDVGEETQEGNHARKPGAESRISELTAKAKAAQEERDNAIAYAQQLESVLQQPTQESETWEDQIASTVMKKQQEQQMQAAQQMAQQKQAEFLHEKVNAARAKHPDFDQKVLNNPQFQISQPMREVLFSSEKGADLAIYLADNPAEMQRIAMNPNPIAQIQEMTRLENRLETPKTVTSAPEPVIPVGSGAAPVDPSKETMEQYAARRQRERFGG